MGHNILKTIIKTLLLFSLCVLVPVNISASSELEKVTLQLQWKDQFEFAGFYAAKEKGFYKDVGLDVDFKAFDNELDIINEVLEERAEYGVVYSSLISRYLEGDPLVFVANFFKHSPLVVVTQKEFQHPSDLLGKKIMGTTNELNESTLIMMFRKFGMSEKDFISIPPSFEIADFITKKVDAMVVFTTNETYRLDEAGVAYNVMNPAAYGVPFYDLNLFTTQKELKEHPKRVANFKAASIKGWKYALKHKEEIIQLILKKYNTQNKSYEALKYEATQIEHIMLPSIYAIGSIDHKRVELIAENFIEINLVSKHTVIDLKNFIYREPQKDLELTIDERTKETILNRWSSITFKEVVNNTLLWKISTGFLLIFLLLYYKYRMLKNHNKELKVDSIKDSLSGLYNRRHIDKMIAKEQKSTNMSNDIFSLILMDVDGFKMINDTYGHEYGDKVISQISNILMNSSRADDIVSRWGGDEFLILCPKTGREEASQSAERLRRTIESTTFDIDFTITCSFGVAQYNKEHFKNDPYIKKVDHVLSLAKQSGKNKVVLND